MPLSGSKREITLYFEMNIFIKKNYLLLHYIILITYISYTITIL